MNDETKNIIEYLKISINTAKKNNYTSVPVPVSLLESLIKRTEKLESEASEHDMIINALLSDEQDWVRLLNKKDLEDRVAMGVIAHLSNKVKSLVAEIEDIKKA